MNASILNYSYEKITPNPKNAQKLLGDGVNAYAYDFNGSQTSRTGGASYGFVNDLDNRLASITGAESATYTYDYQGRRSSKTVSGVTTKYLYDGLNLVSESTGGATTRYAFGPSIDEPLALYASGAVSYLNADGLGSIVATNSTAGNVSHSSVFDAWGLAKTETGTRAHSFTYTGREVGEAGLHFYRARLLQPGAGRFTQEDPILFAADVHFYRLTFNEPVSLHDPLGLWAFYQHNRILRLSFEGVLPPNDIQLLEDASSWADGSQFQTMESAYRHGMGRGDEAPDRVTKARERWERFKCEQMALALKMPSRELALWNLGLAIHAIADSFSPPHSANGGFEVWWGDARDWPGLPAHFAGDTEAYDPDRIDKAVAAIRVYYNEYLNRGGK